jgi:hypothetical protein
MNALLRLVKLHAMRRVDDPARRTAARWCGDSASAALRSVRRVQIQDP